MNIYEPRHEKNCFLHMFGNYKGIYTVLAWLSRRLNSAFQSYFLMWPDSGSGDG